MAIFFKIDKSITSNLDFINNPTTYTLYQRKGIIGARKTSSFNLSFSKIIHRKNYDIYRIRKALNTVADQLTLDQISAISNIFLDLNSKRKSNNPFIKPITTNFPANLSDHQNKVNEWVMVQQSLLPNFKLKQFPKEPIYSHEQWLMTDFNSSDENEYGIDYEIRDDSTNPGTIPPLPSLVSNIGNHPINMSTHGQSLIITDL